MAREYRYPVFLTEDDFTLLREIVTASKRGGKAKADARKRISLELLLADGEGIECDEKGNVPRNW